jgi:hypothetical protein
MPETTTVVIGGATDVVESAALDGSPKAKTYPGCVGKPRNPNAKEPIAPDAGMINLMLPLESCPMAI